ncbi:NAD(P)/FAD-dependent oxidoreductase, partial [bacterium]|nr:NAD(P)/FAD-dependent oxidoreductase [bacterium]
MLTPTRRSLLKYAGAAAAVSAVSTPWVARAAGHKVVVVGGGPAGAAAAHYLKRFAPDIDVTLIEANPTHHTCFMSNEVIVGLREMDKIAVGYDRLKKVGVNVVFDFVTAIDAGAKKILTQGGQSFAYDRCVVAPGIDFKFDSIAGYSAEAAEILPHAYKAGPQTLLLRKQLEAMPDGGTFVMVAPPNPFRCPPGPYERASLVADYFKRHKPKSKVVILDAKDAFSKQKLFEEAWTKQFGYGSADSMITWVSAKQGGSATEVDVAGKTVLAGAGSFKGDVINVIPPQTAG